MDKNFVDKCWGKLDNKLSRPIMYKRTPADDVKSEAE